MLGGGTMSISKELNTIDCVVLVAISCGDILVSVFGDAIFFLISLSRTGI